MATQADGDPDAVLHLPPVRASAAVARHFVASELHGAAPELVEDAVLLVDELVANALLHAGTPIDVTVRHESGCVRIDVADRANELPRPRVPDVDATGGRGLQLVDRLADGGWGVDPAGVGKSVWFALRTPGAPPRGPHRKGGA
jgi:hypothetical protein